MKMYLLLNKVL